MKDKQKDTNNEIKKETKIRYRVSQRNFFTRITWLLLGLSIVFTLMANWGFWKVDDEYFIYLQIILPIVSCVLYMLIINHMGEKGFFLTFLPVMLGTAYLIICESNAGKPLHSILIITLCIIVTMAYVMTVFGLIRSKWLLIPIFALPMAYRILVEDKELLFGSSAKLGDILPELGVLCMLCAMIFIVFAMKKRDFNKDEKPIEEILVELEENHETEEAQELVQELPEAIPQLEENSGLIDNEATIIESVGEKHE